MSSRFFCNYHMIINSNEQSIIDGMLRRLNKESVLFASPSTIQPYHKGLDKIEIFGYVDMPEINFDNVLTWLCRRLQLHVRSWQVSGDYEHEIKMTSENTAESGLSFISLTISRLIS